MGLTRARVHPLLAPLTLVAVLGVRYWKLLTGYIPASGDSTLAYAPSWWYTATHLSHWVIPWWTDRLFAGYPFSADPQTLVFYPPMWILSHLFDPRLMVSAVVLFNLAVLATYTYLYTRRVSHSTAASFFASLVYVLSGFIATRSISFIGAIAWWVAALYYLECALATPRTGSTWPLWSGLAMSWALEMTAGSPTISIIAAYALLLYAVVRIRGHLRAYGSLALALGASGLLALPTLVSTYILWQNSSRAVLTWAFITSGSATPSEFLSILTLGGHWGLFIGLTPAILAIAACLLPRQQPTQFLTWILIILFFSLVALGSNTVFYSLFLKLPGVSLFRIPSRALFVVAFGCVIIASLGLATIERLAPAKRGLFSGVMIVSACLQLWYVPSFAGGPAPTNTLLYYQDLISPAPRALSQGAGPLRVKGWDGSPRYYLDEPHALESVLAGQTSLFYMTRNISGDHYFTISWYQDLFDFTKQYAFSNKVSELWSLRYFLSTCTSTQDTSPCKHVPRGRLLVGLFSRVTTESLPLAKRTVISNSFNPAMELVVNQEIPSIRPGLSSIETVPLSAVRTGSGWWTVVLRHPVEGVLLIPEIYFPGWEAQVNGITQPVVRADYAFIGVPLLHPASTVRVSLHFVAPWQPLLPLSVLCWIAALVSLLVTRMRSRAKAGRNLVLPRS